MIRQRIGAALVGAIIAGACSSDPQATDTTTATTAAPIPGTSTTLLSATTTTAAAAIASHVTGDLTAEQLATELSAVERAAAGGDATVGQRQQLLYRYMSAHPDLDETVIAEVADD